MRTPAGFELTYCSNIHPAEGWPQVFDNLRRHSTELKNRLSPNAPFGIGLRLANREAVELLEGENLQEFAAFLDEAGLYIALLNGFPYGWFHERRLKDQVFAPDWHRTERVDYTRKLVEILRQLLPEGLDGGVSTCPLSYKRWYAGASRPDWDLLVDNLLIIVQAMLDTKRRYGCVLHLDIEPEPDGLVENTAEFIRFFEMLLQKGPPLLAKHAQLTNSQAEEALREHIAICYDLCHFAVECEEVDSTLSALRAAGIRIGRVQLSSAVKAGIPPSGPKRKQLQETLASLADPVYLHQTIGDSERFADLPDGIAHLEGSTDSEWRIHYHVPLFLSDYGNLGSTQSDVRNALAQLTPEDARHLEIETYTWSVLPPELKLDIVDSIEREYRWVLAQV
jgi:sugar phosphate isomerase/epimerase